MAAATVISKTSIGAYIKTIANGDYTVQRWDELLLLDGTLGPVNITLLNPALYPGQEHIFKRIDNVLINAVTLIGTIDGVVNKTLTALNMSYRLKSTGIAWVIIG